MKDLTISTKQIRDNLVPFLESLNDGRQVTVIHRSKPLVVLQAAGDEVNEYGVTPGSKEALRQAVRVAATIRESAAGVLDPQKSVKELYAEGIGSKHGVL